MAIFTKCKREAKKIDIKWGEYSIICLLKEIIKIQNVNFWKISKIEMYVFLVTYFEINKITIDDFKLENKNKQTQCPFSKNIILNNFFINLNN